MSEQAVLGGPDTSARDDVDIPRSHDDGVANAAVVRLYAAPFNSGVEVMLGPLQFTLASWAAPVRFGIANANIAQSLAVPLTSIVAFVAVMIALPLDCIRSPVWLLPEGLLLLRMVTPSAVIEMSALAAVMPGVSGVDGIDPA